MEIKSLNVFINKNNNVALAQGGVVIEITAAVAWIVAKEIQELATEIKYPVYSEAKK